MILKNARNPVDIGNELRLKINADKLCNMCLIFIIRILLCIILGILSWPLTQQSINKTGVNVLILSSFYSLYVAFGLAIGFIELLQINGYKYL
jgi:hypothetical protein